MPADHLIDISVDSPFRRRVDVDSVEYWVRAALESRRLRIARVVSVRITGARAIRRLNRRWRNEDAPTDVLSFNTGFEGISRPDGAADLGEIVIALPLAARGARQRGVELADELALLAVHGTLHLLGFDHEDPWEDAAMREMERVALRRAGRPQAARPPLPAAP